MAVFLPLPARFSRLQGLSAGQALKDSFYVIGAIALLVSGFCFIGLQNLKGEENTGWEAVWHWNPTTAKDQTSQHNGVSHEPSGGNEAPYRRLFWNAIILGFTNSSVAIAYLGGFVARYRPVPRSCSSSG